MHHRVCQVKKYRIGSLIWVDRQPYNGFFLHLVLSGDADDKIRTLSVLNTRGWLDLWFNKNPFGIGISHRVIVR